MSDLFVSAARLGDLPPTYEEPWLLENIWTRNGFNVLVGAPKARKSTLRRYLTACALAGHPAFDRFHCRDTVQRALVCFGEGAIQAEGALLHAACAAQQVPDAGNRITLVKPFGLHLDNKLRFHEFQAYVKGEAFDLVIIDPLLYFHGAEENDALGMGRVCAALIELAASTAVVVVHHTAKASAGTPDRPVTHRGRGSSTLGGAADTFLELTRTGPNTHRLEFATRSAEEPEKMVLTYAPDSGLWSTGEDPLIGQVVAYVKANPGLTANQIVKGVGRRREKILEILRKLSGNQRFLVVGDTYTCVPEPTISKTTGSGDLGTSGTTPIQLVK